MRIVREAHRRAASAPRQASLRADGAPRAVYGAGVRRTRGRASLRPCSRP
jgi:hypothetical protein